MNSFIADTLIGYWTPQEIAANIGVVLNIIGALALGLVVGYERSYHGRAAGMRTYGLVCMASCGITVICGYPEHWFGGHIPMDASSVGVGRAIQGITTGIGFLCAGVIMRDGLNISGLTTAASIWTVATIGILVGIGFYSAAITLTVISASFMMWGAKFENLLPACHAIVITLHFHKFTSMKEDDIARLMKTQGYALARGSFSINHNDEMSEWRFVATSLGRDKCVTLVSLGEFFKNVKEVSNFHIAYARN